MQIIWPFSQDAVSQFEKTVLAYSRSLEAGRWVPAFDLAANAGFGSAEVTTSPYLPSLFSAFLHWLGMGVSSSLHLLLGIMALAGFASTYFWLRLQRRTHLASFLGGLLFVTSSAVVSLASTGFDLRVSPAIAAVPFLFWGVSFFSSRDFGLQSRKKMSLSLTVAFFIFFGMIPPKSWGLLVLAWGVLYFAAREKTWLALRSAILAVFLSVFFFYPLWIESSYQVFSEEPFAFSRGFLGGDFYLMAGAVIAFFTREDRWLTSVLAGLAALFLLSQGVLSAVFGAGFVASIMVVILLGAVFLIARFFDRNVKNAFQRFCFFVMVLGLGFAHCFTVFSRNDRPTAKFIDTITPFKIKNPAENLIESRSGRIESRCMLFNSYEAGCEMFVTQPAQVVLNQVPTSGLRLSKNGEKIIYSLNAEGLPSFALQPGKISSLKIIRTSSNVGFVATFLSVLALLFLGFNYFRKETLQ